MKKTSADPFNLKGCEKMKGAKRLSEQPKSSRSVPGIEVNTIGNRPSSSRTVKGMPKKLK